MRRTFRTRTRDFVQLSSLSPLRNMCRAAARKKGRAPMAAFAIGICKRAGRRLLRERQRDPGIPIIARSGNSFLRARVRHVVVSLSLSLTWAPHVCMRIVVAICVYNARTRRLQDARARVMLLFVESARENLFYLLRVDQGCVYIMLLSLSLPLPLFSGRLQR